MHDGQLGIRRENAAKRGDGRGILPSRRQPDGGTVRVDDPDTVTRLLLGALTRGALLIANSDDPVTTRHAVSHSMRTLLNAFAP